MKKQGNPVIERSHLAEHGHLVGQKLRDALASTDAELLDVHARMGYQRRHLLEAMIHRAGRSALLHRLESFLRHEALDPNRPRLPPRAFMLTML